MSTLLIGFDSAWSEKNRGGIVGLLRLDDGSFKSLGKPCAVNFLEAEKKICCWKSENQVEATVVMIDQPTIVKNDSGQRPVENIVSSPVGRRRGGVQSANTGDRKKDMFGKGAPIWGFLKKLGGPTNPRNPIEGTNVIETYPVLSIIALGWTLYDENQKYDRLPKYNPKNKNFSGDDWKYLCSKVKDKFNNLNVSDIVCWLNDCECKTKPKKADQDCLDACICLLVALSLAEREKCLMIGKIDNGYMVVPYCRHLSKEIEDRCQETERSTVEWVHIFESTL